MGAGAGDRPGYPTRVLSAGMLCATVGLYLLTGVHSGGSYSADVLPGGLLAAIGLGLSLVPATIAAVAGVSARESGLASGMLNTSRLIGGALGLAVLSTIAASRTRADLLVGASGPAAQSAGFRIAFAVAGTFSLLGALAAAALLRPARAAVEAPVAHAPQAGTGADVADARVPVSAGPTG